MSLDVYLTVVEPIKREPSIYVRRNGRTEQISREEWDRLNPGQEPVMMPEQETKDMYHGNITHNLTRMAKACGLYFYLWEPEAVGVEYAHQLIIPLTWGCNLLGFGQDYFRTLEPENGWGDFDGFKVFVKEYADACMKYPDAEVSVSR